jgi:hypothetical protein
VILKYIVKCGAEGDRTPDPRLAKPMLSQLSYCPIMYQSNRLETYMIDAYYLQETIII